jgi:hypothetical protein
MLNIFFNTDAWNTQAVAFVPCFFSLTIINYGQKSFITLGPGGKMQTRPEIKRAFNWCNAFFTNVHFSKAVFPNRLNTTYIEQDSFPQKIACMSV